MIINQALPFLLVCFLFSVCNSVINYSMIVCKTTLVSYMNIFTTQKIIKEA